jgi:uncharacterized protein YfaQ (DUF2300 family)
MPLERRLTIRLDDERYRSVSAAARVRRTPLAAVIRDAIDTALPSDRERRQAADALLAAEPMAVPATVEELKAELAEIRAGAKD